MRSQPGGSCGRTTRPGSDVPGAGRPVCAAEPSTVGGSPPPASPATISASRSARDCPREASAPSSAASVDSGAWGDASAASEARFGSRSDCATGNERSERVLRSTSSSRSASRNSNSARPTPGARPPPPASVPADPEPEGALVSRSAGSWRDSVAARCVSRSVSSRRPSSNDRPSRSFTARSCAGAPAADSSSPGPASDDENSNPATSTAIRTIPAFVTKPPGSAPFGSFTHCFQPLIGSPPGARTASRPAGRRSGATRRPARGGRRTARPR